MENNKIKVYVKTNGNHEIIDVNSEVFIKDYTDWTYIDEGLGDKYALAQTHYFEKPLFEDDGKPNYKYDNKKVVEVKQ